MSTVRSEGSTSLGMKLQVIIVEAVLVVVVLVAVAVVCQRSYIL
jgi:hypothetical protein